MYINIYKCIYMYINVYQLNSFSTICFSLFHFQFYNNKYISIGDILGGISQGGNYLGGNDREGDCLGEITCMNMCDEFH